MHYTVEVYKRDGRTRSGERLYRKSDHVNESMTNLQHLYGQTYPESQGYRLEYHETYVTSVNHISDKPFQERYDTPFHCSPSSESYWSS
jgi:hypothetical protein